VPHRGRAAVVLALAPLLALLTSCFTGERASIDSTATLPNDGEPSDTGVDSGLPTSAKQLADLLGSPATGPETATYEITPTSQSTPVVAVVSRDGGRTVVSIRDVQYRTDEGGPSTCRRNTGTCSRGFNSQPLSDLGISALFWGPSVRQELRSPTLAARIGPIATSQADIAGQSATCIDIPGPQVTERFCALGTGMLAAKSTARVVITLTSYAATFDESLWAEFATE